MNAAANKTINTNKRQNVIAKKTLNAITGKTVDSDNRQTIMLTKLKS